MFWRRVPKSTPLSLFIRTFSTANASNPFLPKFYCCPLQRPCFYGDMSKVFNRYLAVGQLQGFSILGRRSFHSGKFLNEGEKDVKSLKQSENSTNAKDAGTKVKRKKLKGRRAVVKWVKHFRWKKKKEQQRMTAEEKLLYKLNKARKKEERLVNALKKLEPKEWSEATHDPEVLTPEEHFYFLKMGLKCKNYVPVGRRGIYQGVILNMHLHWKKHQTLQVIVKTFTPEEVKEIAVELARLTGGIVLEIHEENTIIMYRGKNYSQPPTEIMSPKITLSRKKAFDKSTYRDGLRAVRRYIPRLEQEIELLRAQLRNKEFQDSEQADTSSNSNTQGTSSASIPISQSAPSKKLKELMAEYDKTVADDDSMSDDNIISDSEDLSDLFETESESEEKEEKHLYLQEFDKIPAKDSDKEQMSPYSGYSLGKGKDLAEFDEIDQMFLRAAELLKKKNR